MEHPAREQRLSASTMTIARSQRSAHARWRHGMPMSIATTRRRRSRTATAELAVERRGCRASRCRPRRRATSAAAVSAPSPANAIWPSESCPAHPVSTTTDTAHSANATIVVHVWWRSDSSDEQRQDDRGEQARTPATSCGSAPHPPDLPQPLGHRGDSRRELEALAAACASRLLTRATSTSTTRKSTNCTRPVSLV